MPPRKSSRPNKGKNTRIPPQEPSQTPRRRPQVPAPFTDLRPVKDLSEEEQQALIYAHGDPEVDNALSPHAQRRADWLARELEVQADSATQLIKEA